jgi:hypothetical protein
LARFGIRSFNSKLKKARDWFDRFHRANPHLLAPLGPMSWQRPNIGSRVTRKVPARFWECREDEVPPGETVEVKAYAVGHAVLSGPWSSQ